MAVVVDLGRPSPDVTNTWPAHCLSVPTPYHKHTHPVPQWRGCVSAVYTRWEVRLPDSLSRPRPRPHCRIRERHGEQHGPRYGMGLRGGSRTSRCVRHLALVGLAPAFASAREASSQLAVYGPARVPPHRTRKIGGAPVNQYNCLVSCRPPAGGATPRRQLQELYTGAGHQL